MNLRRHHSPAIAGAKAGFSTAAAYRFEKDPRLPSQKRAHRERRRADPFVDVWENEVLPMLKAAPGLRPIAVFEELCRRHPELGSGTRRQRLLTGALASVRKPTIAALPGPAVGAGLAIAMACDIRIAAQSAFVSTGYLRVGLSGDYGIAWLLTRLVGTARARELMFTADKVEAARCEVIGLVNRVVPDASLQDEAFALARSMAEGPTIALRYMKDNLDEGLLFDFATARDHEAERLIRTTMTSDHREAVQAFIEKRKAVFKGN